MTLVWIDATAGVAGDMLLAALVDAGADLAAVQAAVEIVVPGAVRLSTRVVERQGQRALKLDVEVLLEDPPHRAWSDIRRMLQDAELDAWTRTRALATMERLAQAEGRVHGIDPEQVHFHEVGALDSIADVVGVCEALRLLGVSDAVGSSVAVGAGSVRVAHGLMPVPVPAVAQLALGWPTHSGVIPARATGHGHHHEGDSTHDTHDHQQGHAPRDPGELATPTGMALVRSICPRSGAQPAMVTTAIGVGAGTKDTPGRPNVVRVLLGHEASQAPGDVVTELQANVDDLDPRLWPGVLDRVMAAGAADVWLVPIQMKKGRPAHTLHVLVTEDQMASVTEAVFSSTTTFGVRRHQSVHRTTLHRVWRDVDLDGTKVRVKLAVHQGRVVRATPEFEDVAAWAVQAGVEQVEALSRASAAAAAAGWVVGAPAPTA